MLGTGCKGRELYSDVEYVWSLKLDFSGGNKLFIVAALVSKSNIHLMKRLLKVSQCPELFRIVKDTSSTSKTNPTLTSSEDFWKNVYIQKIGMESNKKVQ